MLWATYKIIHVIKNLVAGYRNYEVRLFLGGLAALMSLSSYAVTPSDQGFNGEQPRYMVNAGETITNAIYSMVSPTSLNGAFVALAESSDFVSIASGSDYAVMFNYDGATVVPGAVDARITSVDGSEFRIVSMEIDTGAGLSTTSALAVTGYRDGVSVVSDSINTGISDSLGSVSYVKNGRLDGFGGVLTFNSAWNYVDEIRFTGSDTIVVVDDLDFEDGIPPTPTITSANYNASTGALSVTGTIFTASAGDDVIANKFAITAEGGSTYTLTDTANVEISSATGFTLTLSATDRVAVNQIINKNGTSSTGGTTYNLAGAAGFIAASAATADTTGNGITVSNVAAPAITSATYDASTGVLAVTGTNLKKFSGAANDIVANKFTLTGEGGATYTLEDTANVELTSGTSFTLTLGAGDKAAINMFLNNNGVSSAGGTTYNLSAAEDWAAGADAAVVVGDLTGNGITVSNAVDTQPPVFQNSTPSIGNINTTSATLVVQLNEIGSAFYVVIPDGADAPSSAQVIAGQNSSGAAALMSGSINVASAGVDYASTINGLSAGTAYDIYVVAQNATENTQASPTLVNLTTSTDNALYFDGDAQVTGFYGMPLFHFTVEFKLYFDSDMTSRRGIYWDRHGGGIFLEGDNSIYFAVDDGFVSYTSEGKLAAGTWNHVAISYDGFDVRMYLNGSPTGVVMGGESSFIRLPYFDVVMGWRDSINGFDYDLGGSALDDFRIWRLARSEEEINNNKDAELSPPYPQNLETYYDFNHGIGGANNENVTTLINRTGYGENGTLIDFSLDGDTSNWVEVSSLTSSPTVTDGNISISGASGTDDAFKVGDTVTAIWNNTAGGDNNGGITDVTVDFSEFGGGAAVVATEVDGIWTATYTVVSGGLDATSRNISVTVSGAIGQTTVADTTNATVDNIPPSVTDGNVSISGGSGLGDAYKIGDTITVTWNNTTGGDNNSDTISTVAVNFSAFGGGAAVAATNSAGVWTATYTLVAGAIDANNLNVSVTVTDKAGNSTTQADSSNATVDTVAPTVTDANISISGASGTGDAFIIGDTVTATWNNTAGGDNNSEAFSSVTVDFTQFGGGAAVAATNSGGTWTATYAIVAGTISAANLNVSVTATDNAGNATATAGASNAVVDTVAPVVSTVSVPANAFYVSGQNLDFTVNVSENVTVTGSPQIALTLGSTTRQASFINGSGTSALVFRYIIQAGDNDSDGIAIAAGIDANGGTLRDAAGNSLVPTLNSIGSLAGVFVDAVAPTVASVSVPADDTYVAGESLTFTLNTSEAVTVTGTPQIALTIGGSTRAATYVGGTGTSALVFSYTVQAGDFDSDGITVDALSASGATLRDASGNSLNLTLNSVGSVSGVLVDTVAPTLESLSPADETTGVAPNANLIITLSEDIALGTGNIVISDSNDTPISVVDVANPAGQLSISGATLTLDLAANLVEDVSYYVLIDNGAVTDLVDNPFAGISDPTVWNFTVADITPPVVTSITVSGSPAASAAAIQFTVTFDEVPANISVSDFTLTPSGADVSGTVASVSPVNLNTVTVTIDQISGTGTLRLDVNADSGITDAAGNGGGENGYVAAFTSGDPHTVDRDAPAAPPAPGLVSTSDSGESDTDNITNDSTPTFEGMAEASTTVTVTSSIAGSLGTATANASGNWTFTSAALVDGDHEISVTATDAAGNASEDSDALTLQLDSVAPSGHSVGLNVDIYNVANVGSAGFVFADAEIGARYNYEISSTGGGTPVTGSGELASATEAVSDLNLATLPDGTLTLSVVVSDVAGNAAAAVTATATKDVVLPAAPSISFLDTGLNAAEAGSAGFSFSGAEIGMAYTYTITSSGGGTAVTDGGIWSDVSGEITGIDVSGLLDGVLTLSLAVTDASGNPAEPVTATATLDKTVPTVAISSETSDPINSTFIATITFSEAVSGFVIGDITATNAILSSMTSIGEGSYSVTITPTADGTVLLNVAADVAVDAVGNGNSAADPFSLSYDGSAPAPVLTTAASDPTNQPFVVDIAFGEPVTGFTIGDISAVNATLSDLANNGGGSYSVTVTPSAEGTVTLDIAADAAEDSAGNASLAAAQLSLVYDTAVPAPTITSDEPDPTNNASFPVTIAFGETVEGFLVEDITAVNATLSGFTNNSSGNYSVTVTPTSDGTVSVSLAAGAAQDAAANDSLAASFSLTYDGTAPTLASSIPADGAGNVDFDTDLILTFSEAVVAGSGNITLYEAADDAVVETFDVAGLAIANTVVTLPLTSSLTPTHSYYLQADSGVFIDAAGNVYTGIADKTTLNFTVANAAPLANADLANVAEDTSVDIIVLVNDTDNDSSLNAASVTVISAPQHGSTSVNTATGVITYTPAANFNGMDTFTYTVEDVFGAVSNAAAVTLTVIPVNDAPVAVADLANTPEDSPISIDVAANDTDVDVGDNVDPDSIAIVTAPAHGIVVVVNGQVLYTPHLDYNGSDSFTYTIDDQSGVTSNVATVIINVTGVNDLPDAVNDTTTVVEDDSVDIDVLANDDDVDGSIDATSVSILATASNGTTEVDALTGVIIYTPDVNFHGSDSFTYVVQDNDGGTSNAATVSVTVTSVNDAPVANPDTATLLEDTAHTLNVLGNDSDLDGTLVLASVEVVTAAQHGTTQVNPTTGAIVYTPGENFNGSDSFTYRVQDNEGAWSAPAVVTLTVADVNDEPLANNDLVTTDEDAAVTIDLLDNDSDVDGVLDPLSLSLTEPAHGTLIDHGDGTVQYTPNANFFGTDSFTYTVTDDDGGISNSATVTVTVDPVNDTPVISGTPAVTVAQDAAYSFTPMASDVDADTTLTFSITDQPEWASFNPTTGALTGTPGNDDVGDYSGIVITVSDGLLSASLPAFAIEVTNVNDPPVISGTPVGTINQDGSYNFVPAVVDVDANTTLSFSVVNLPHWASFNPSTGAITGTPGNSDVGIYNNIVISVSDGVTTTTLAGFDITVANVNDPPVIRADSYSLDEGGLLQPNADNGVLANDSDIDGDNLIAILVDGPRHASEFSWNENGSFRYQHNGTETRSDSFTYRISDGTVNSSAVTVSLNITAINDAPVFVTQPPLVVVEGGVYSYDVGVTDPDSTVSLSLQDDAPDWLALDGFRLSGTAPINEVGAVSVVLRATDGEYTVDQTYDLTVLEREASLVIISTNWRGLPSIVDNTVDLQITLAHASGPAVSGALQVSLQGLESAATMANCTSVNQDFACPVNLATGASTGFRLRVTPEEAGNLVVLLRLNSGGEQLASAITDVSVTERAVSQGNVTFKLANATALASINLLNDGTRELVAGTNLGDTVKLLNYTLTSGSAQVLSEINNRGYTERVRVADIDQDGLEDILVVNRNGDASAVYYDRGDEFVAEAGSVPLPHGREALLRDLNDDGYPELILGAGGFNLYIYENNEGIYDTPPLVFSSPASIIHFALLRRLPTDASLEGTLVISSAAAVQLVRFGLDPDNSAAKPSEGEGASVMNEKFTLLREIPLSGVSTIQLVDVDGDGREEIIASTTHQNDAAENSGVSIIGITDDGLLQPIARLGAASAKKVEVADFNGDGIADLLVANVNNSYQFYRGTGNPANWTLTNTILYHSSTLVIPEDVNGDGLADVLIYEDGNEQVELYLSAPEGDTGETADLTLSATTRVVRNDRYHFEYAVNVMNEGTSVAEHPRVTVPLPDGIDVVTLPEYCVEDEEVDEVTCNLQNLAPGAGQIIPLILASDWRINNLSLTARTTSDALEIDMADNTATTSLAGMFEYKRARIKGGGGSVNLMWFGALMGLAFARRRREKPRVGRTLGGKSLSVALPLAVAAGLLNAPMAEAASPGPNSYVEGSLGLISSDWDMMTFYYDLSGSTQEAVLVEKDDQRFGWQLLYGYRVNSRLALELGYLDSGQTELEVETVISETDALRQVLIDHAPVAGDGPYAGVRFSFVHNDQQEIYAKVGLWSWSAGYALTLGEQTEWVKRSGEDWLIGLGFSLPVMERLKLGGSIQTTALDNDRLIFVGVNLIYQFDVTR